MGRCVQVWTRPNNTSARRTKSRHPWTRPLHQSISGCVRTTGVVVSVCTIRLGRYLGSSDLTGLQTFGAYLCLYNLPCIVVHAYSLYVRVKNPASNIMSMTNISSKHGSFPANFATFRHNNFSNTLRRCTYFMFD